MALARFVGGDFRSHRPYLSPLRASLPFLTTCPRWDQRSSTRWVAIKREVRCQGRFSCFFSNGGSKQEQARRALESALGGKKSEFEKWNKEIERRTEMDGGGTSGRGGSFGGRWFGWFNNEHFWEEAQQTILTILGILLLFLLLTKGNVMTALVFNSLLFVLRGIRNWFSFVSARSPLKASSGPAIDPSANVTFENRKSAKDSVVSKWRTD